MEEGREENRLSGNDTSLLESRHQANVRITTTYLESTKCCWPVNEKTTNLLIILLCFGVDRPSSLFGALNQLPQSLKALLDDFPARCVAHSHATIFTKSFTRNDSDFGLLKGYVGKWH